MKDILVEDTTG